MKEKREEGRARKRGMERDGEEPVGKQREAVAITDGISLTRGFSIGAEGICGDGLGADEIVVRANGLVGVPRLRLWPSDGCDRIWVCGRGDAQRLETVLCDLTKEVKPLEQRVEVRLQLHLEGGEIWIVVADLIVAVAVHRVVVSSMRVADKDNSGTFAFLCGAFSGEGLCRGGAEERGGGGLTCDLERSAHVWVSGGKRRATRRHREGEEGREGGQRDDGTKGLM